MPTSYEHCFCLSWFSTCWPFPLEFPPLSSQIYRLSHCLQIPSKNSPFLWPLTISIQALLIRHINVDFGVLKLYYVMLHSRYSQDLCPNLFAEDTQVYVCCSPSEMSNLATRVTAYTDDILNWMQSNRLQLNANKMELI